MSQHSSTITGPSAPPRGGGDMATFTADAIAVAVDGQLLLEDISFRLEPGQLLAITGPSGCGKTMLLRSLAGLIDPVAGQLRLNGEAPQQLGWPAYRRRVLLVHQQPVLTPGTIRDNLERPFRYRAAASPWNEAAATRFLERLHIEAERLEQRADSLSVGQQQRVCLVRALLLQPDVLLLDEPTSALDETARDAVEALIREVAMERSTAAVIVTHDAAQAERWCDVQLALQPTAGGNGQ